MAGANDQQSVYSTANTLDRQDVIITAGNNGRIEMKVPPFSSQTFVSRRRLASRDWKLKIRTHSSDASGLVSLSIQTGDDFPALDGNKYLALSGKRIYTLKYDSATKRLELFGSKKTLNEFCQRDFNAMYGNPWISKRNGPEDIRSEKQRFLDDSLPTLVARSLLDDLILRPFEFRLAPDRIRLFVYTDIPKEFQIAVSADVQASGRILFTKDLQLQDQTTATR